MFEVFCHAEFIAYMLVTVLFCSYHFVLTLLGMY